MTEKGRLQPFVAVTKSNVYAMSAKGNFRPLTALHWLHSRRPLADQEAAVRTTSILLQMTQSGICHPMGSVLEMEDRSVCDKLLDLEGKSSAPL